MRKRMDGGLSVRTISKLLNNASYPRSFTDLRMVSTPIYKLGFCKYLRWMKEHELVNRWRDGNNVMYLVTERGREFLRLVE